jgi:hypothetical protein
MGNVVHFVIRNDIQAGPLQVVLDHNARSRGRLRWYDECFAHDLSQLDGIMRGKAVVARQLRSCGRKSGRTSWFTGV